MAVELFAVRAWSGRAACADAEDGGAFFEIEDAVDEGREPDEERVAGALALCARCPVREECLRTSESGNDFGIWGGKTAEERGRPYRLARRSRSGRRRR